MRKYSKTNTDPKEVDDKIKEIEETFGIHIEAILEMDETGIYPVIKYSKK